MKTPRIFVWIKVFSVAVLLPLLPQIAASQTGGQTTEQYIESEIRPKLERALNAVQSRVIGDVSDVKPPDNWMGATPQQMVQSQLEDLAELLKNFVNPFGGCVSWSPVACGCFQFAYAWPPTLLNFDPGKQYRWPVDKGEIVRQPFQSDYIPAVLNQVNKLAIDQVFYGTQIMLLPMQARILQVKAIVSGLDGLTTGVAEGTQAAMETLKDMKNNPTKYAPMERYRHYMDLGNVRSAVSHMIPEPYRIIKIPYIFNIHKSKDFWVDLGDGIENFAVSQWPFATALVNRGQFTPMLALAQANPFICAMANQVPGFGAAPVDLLAPYIPPILMGGENNPCMKKGLGKLVPFTVGTDVNDEPSAALVQFIKGKVTSVAKYPKNFYQYDLTKDKIQFVRGDGLKGNSAAQCTDITRTLASWGSAIKEEYPAIPIAATHWKRVRGCEFKDFGFPTINIKVGSGCWGFSYGDSENSIGFENGKITGAGAIDIGEYTLSADPGNNSNNDG